MIKGVTRINKYINKWLKQHGFECTAIYGLDFSYDFINEMITYSFTVPTSHDQIFLEVCQSVEPKIKQCDNFILSFFHEIGHSITDDDFTDKQHEDYLNLIARLNEKPKLTKRDYKKYYLNDIELAATKWGCNYIVKNKKEVKEFATQIGKLFEQFAKENNLNENDVRKS